MVTLKQKAEVIEAAQGHLELIQQALDELGARYVNDVPDVDFFIARVRALHDEEYGDGGT